LKYENVCNCQFSSVSEKIDYLNALAACGTETEALAAHETFRAGRLRTGPPPGDLEPTEGLGVLTPENTFRRRVAEAGRHPYDHLKGKYDLWMSYEEKREKGQRPVQAEIEAATIFRMSDAPVRSDGTIWLFRNPQRKEDAFEGVLSEWLAARLGLEVHHGEVRLAFTFPRMRVTGIAMPRFTDASWAYLEKWQWGGRTRPLHGTPSGLGGLEEVVADPPKLEALYKAPRRVTSRVP
jgi:hypothetical protein